jgi:hypothetical protein
LREFNTGGWRRAAALSMALATVTLASADEVRKWRDAEGNLHYSITGSPSGSSDDRDRPTLQGRAATPEEAFSVEASLHRREIEKKLTTASSALDEIRARIRDTEKKKFETWVPVVTDNPRAAQASLDAQRDALLAAQQFDQDKTDTLRRLRRREHEQLRAVSGLWNEFGALDGQVVARYGKPPGWWRKRLDCGHCPTLAEAEAELHRARPTPIAGEKSDKQAPDDDDEEGWEKAWE